MIGILIADLRRDFLNAHFQILRQQVIGLGQTNINQIMNRCVSGFRLENPGHIKGAQIHIAGDPVKRDFLCIMIFKVIRDLLHEIFPVRGFKGASTCLLRLTGLFFFPQQQKKHLHGIRLHHIIAPDPAKLLLCLHCHTELGKLTLQLSLRTKYRAIPR